MADWRQGNEAFQTPGQVQRGQSGQGRGLPDREYLLAQSLVKGLREPGAGCRDFEFRYPVYEEIQIKMEFCHATAIYTFT